MKPSHVEKSLLDDSSQLLPVFRLINIAALIIYIIRIGFWGPCHYKKIRNPQNSIGNYLSLHSRPACRATPHWHFEGWHPVGETASHCCGMWKSLGSNKRRNAEADFFCGDLHVCLSPWQHSPRSWPSMRQCSASLQNMSAQYSFLPGGSSCSGTCNLKVTSPVGARRTQHPLGRTVPGRHCMHVHRTMQSHATAYSNDL